MSELLVRLLQTPGEFTSRLPDLKSSSPPQGVTKQEWDLRQELPLHLINFLRDEAEPLLSLAQSTGPSPQKAHRPAKYDYTSPLKPVQESPGKPRILQSENNKKPKKKVKLFSAKISGKVHKSFSDVEDQLDFRTEASNGSANGEVEGIRQLPTSPHKSSSKNGFRKSHSTSLFSVPENGDHRQPIKKSYKPSEKRTELETPSTNNGRQYKKKQSLSPQTLSLADFMAPIQKRGGKKNNKTPQSPNKIKSSTPIEDHVVPRVTNNRKVKMIPLDFSSSDSFPEIGESEIKKRMKPILVSSTIDAGPVNPVFCQKNEETNSGHTESPFMVEEVEKKTFDTREMVREIQSMTTPLKSTNASMKTPNKTPTLSRSNSVVSTAASPHAVEKSEYLNLLATLYSYVLNNNLMPNFNVELYFVIELLLIDVPQELPSAKESSSLYLSSVHNCVYFACQVIFKTVELLVFLDKTTLRLLIDNSRISQFCPDLPEHLGEVCDSKSIPSPLMKSRANRSHQGLENVSFLTVSFQSETDNRSNFPNNSSFHDFKKQRDKFYSLIRKWGENMKGKDVQFEAAFGVEVETVMVMYQHPVNYYHFAKLWMAQLVAMCRGESLEGAQSDPNTLLMAELKKIDPMKHKKLVARLVTPGRCGGPCPQPSFSGAAEFFRDFILTCNSPKFVRHLRDLLVSEVTKLNSVQLDIGEGSNGVSKLEDSLGWEATVSGGYNEVLVDQYQETVITLRILAKFLGFLESFPYSDPSDLSSDHVSVSVDIRSQTCPALDVARLVTEAQHSGRLVLTLPWVVEFLCQLDQAAHQLPYYSGLYTRLASIYQTRLAPASCLVSRHTAHFLSLYLGWLFENRRFPREVLILSQVSGSEPEKLKVGDWLDMAEVVTPSLVRQCCPWVGEVRTLLQQWEGGKRGSELSLDKTETGSTYRKITPLAAPLDKKGKLDKESMAQSQLEESFFHNQPKSLRRTVEYVSERLASDVIKKIRQIVVPGEKTAFTQCMKEAIKESIFKDKLSGFLVSKVPHYSQQSYEKVRAHAENRLGDSLRSDCESVLGHLLAFDTSPAVRATCVSICARSVGEKVWQWVEQHVTQGYFSREYTIEAERVARQGAREHTVAREAVTLFIGPHEADGTPASELLILLKTQTKSLLIYERTDLDLSSDCLVSVISRIRHCVQTRCELTQLAIRALESLTLDWILTLITKRPEAVSEAVICSVLDFWSILPPPQLVSILSPRNLILLAMSSSPDLTWTRVRELLEALLRSSLVSALSLEDNCHSLVQVATLDTELVPNLKRLSETLRLIADNLDRRDMDWVQRIMPDSLPE